MDTAEKLSGDAAIVLQVKVCLGVWALNLGATDAVETGGMICPLRSDRRPFRVCTLFIRD